MICRIQVNNIISFNETVKYIQERKDAKLWTRFSGCINYWTNADGQNTGWLKIAVFPTLPLQNIYHRNTIPSISTLEAICTSFGISLSQFFAEGEMVELTPELKELFDNWVNLTPQQKDAVLQTMRAMNHDQT